MRRSVSHRRHDLPLRRAEQHDHKRREQPPVSPLIVPRRQAARLLSVSVSTLIRMEQAGTLTRLKLTQADNGQVFYRLADLEQLAGGDNA